jgi:hypothetical protein
MNNKVIILYYYKYLHNADLCPPHRQKWHSIIMLPFVMHNNISGMKVFISLNTTLHHTTTHLKYLIVWSVPHTQTGTTALYAQLYWTITYYCVQTDGTTMYKMCTQFSKMLLFYDQVWIILH